MIGVHLCESAAQKTDRRKFPRTVWPPMDADKRRSCCELGFFLYSYFLDTTLEFGRARVDFTPVSERVNGIGVAPEPHAYQTERLVGHARGQRLAVGS